MAEADPLPQTGLVPADDERYRIHSRVEIVALLRTLAQRRDPVSVEIDARDFIVSAILAVNPDFEEIVLDYGADEASMQRLFRAHRLRLCAHVDGIRITLGAEHAAPTSFEDGPAFRIRLPVSIERLQRREASRLKVPLGRPMHCRVFAGERGSDGVPVRVRDISTGGVGLVDYPPSLGITAGAVFRACRIALPELGTLVTDLEVVHASAGESRRCGCRFLGLSAAMANLVQRYITRAEREQHART
jgi:c-di-GMP-binding flagellar brake protein YcgR